MQDSVPPSLFDTPSGAPADPPPDAPLADRMRPRSLDEVLGQDALIGKETPLRRSLRAGTLPSLILWGPPGCGKTTLARVLAREADAEFREISAVSSGVAALREAVARAQTLRRSGRRTVLFIDEIHRFNKAQQDAILPAVESGDLVLVGATTENPSFEVNAPLRSRGHVVRLDPLPRAVILELADRALADGERGLGGRELTLAEGAREALVRRSGGDARIALNLLEAAASAVADASEITEEEVEALARENTVLYDRASGRHYDHASALQKSLRGSDPDAAIYWMAKMLAAGEDPRFVARRILVTAAEDVGLADSRALRVAVAAFDAVEYLGMPEARIPLAQAAIFVATAPKSNSAISAIDAAMHAITEQGESFEVPPVMRMTGKEKSGYRYPHSAPGHFLPDDYLPEELRGRSFYVPGELGEEADIARRVREVLGRGRARGKDEDTE
ncbi:MAG: replication-associated recombination protein A [Gemmatimonadota bacterium]|nr:replication-associated recombination protein A [Gemmatimonadota bacterium]